jgi:hypothetical protein
MGGVLSLVRYREQVFENSGKQILGCKSFDMYSNVYCIIYPSFIALSILVTLQMLTWCVQKQVVATKIKRDWCARMKPSEHYEYDRECSRSVMVVVEGCGCLNIFFRVVDAPFTHLLVYPVQYTYIEDLKRCQRSGRTEQNLRQRVTRISREFA